MALYLPRSGGAFVVAGVGLWYRAGMGEEVPQAGAAIAVADERPLVDRDAIYDAILVTEEMEMAGLDVIYRAQRNDALPHSYVNEVFREMALKSPQLFVQGLQALRRTDDLP